MMFLSFNNTRLVLLVVQELTTLPEHLSAPSFFYVFYFSVECFVDYCFFFFGFICLFFFDLRLPVTLPLWYLQTFRRKYYKTHINGFYLVSYSHCCMEEKTNASVV
jgi:hypothetical protein